MGVVRRVNRLRLCAERVALFLLGLNSLRDLAPVRDRTGRIRPRDTLLFCTLRNERIRLPHFLDYYRKLGVQHFLFVDNGSSDGTGDYLAGQADVSVWRTSASYKRARYGMDWMNGLLNRHGRGHWCLTVDADEFFVYPHMHTRPLQALTEWLDGCHRRSFGTMLLDMYADRPIAETRYQEGQDPFEILSWFDAANYSVDRNGKYRDLWIQGGPRQRVFFADRPELGPALNKVPLVNWRFGMVYRSSTHNLLPRGLNQVYDDRGGERACGVLLHAKFLDLFGAKAREEIARGQHYAASREYRVYEDKLTQGLSMWTPASTRYRDWRQLEDLGLLSSGSWA
ncbi:glycosyltransferase family 2 protein [Halovulum dunhuangense]|uniref:Glycosyltransferase family 2 protein n=1 Tax=Halovulum dunhuangense TaxID=1505036 RepID=A0A849KY75_9RHOB|nr:glycosyltransferase family 2 protein [Halovulum dunhuangense]NNU78976.1 glycosyltransferase family 2 protein [Halovulum dunhuangense]